LACSAARAYPALVDTLAEEGETTLGYRQVGALVLADSAERQQEISQRLLARQARWPEMGEVSLLDPGQARGLFPPLRPDAWAVHISGAARVDGRLISAACAGQPDVTAPPSWPVMPCSGARTLRWRA
jgi:D-amino-acid dehydrogenase